MFLGCPITAGNVAYSCKILHLFLTCPVRFLWQLKTVFQTFGLFFYFSKLNFSKELNVEKAKKCLLFLASFQNRKFDKDQGT